MPWRIAEGMRSLVRKLYWDDMMVAEIARRVGCSERSISRIIAASPWRPRDKPERQLSLAERE
jgi:uncharacterized protein YjcR